MEGGGRKWGLLPLLVLALVSILIFSTEVAAVAVDKDVPWYTNSSCGAVDFDEDLTITGMTMTGDYMIFSGLVLDSGTWPSIGFYVPSGASMEVTSAAYNTSIVVAVTKASGAISCAVYTGSGINNIVVNVTGTGLNSWSWSDANDEVTFSVTPSGTQSYTITLAGTTADPQNVQTSITNMDDTDNILPEQRTYLIDYDGQDLNSYSNIKHVTVDIKQGSTQRAQFKYVEDTDAFTLEAGGDEFDLVSGSCAYTKSGNSLNLTFAFTVEWDAVNEEDAELVAYIVDDQDASDTDTMQTDYVDIVTRLVIEGLAASDSRVNVSDTVEITGTVYHATTSTGDTASSLYPADAQFTRVEIQSATHTSFANDTTIVNGAFAANITIPATVQSNVVHVYLDLVDDYSDGDSADADTVAVVGDRISLLTLGVDSLSVALNAPIIFYATAESAYDGDDLGSGDQLVMTDNLGDDHTLEWDAADSRFEVSISSATEQTLILTTAGSGSEEATYGITDLNTNSLTTGGTWTVGPTGPGSTSGSSGGRFTPTEVAAQPIDPDVAVPTPGVDVLAPTTEQARNLQNVGVIFLSAGMILVVFWRKLFPKDPKKPREAFKQRRKRTEKEREEIDWKKLDEVI